MRNLLFLCLAYIFLGHQFPTSLKAEVTPKPSNETSPVSTDDNSTSDSLENFGFYTISDAPPPPEPTDDADYSQPMRVEDLKTQVDALSGRVDYFCKAPHDTLIKIPRIESYRELDDSLELIRSYEQPTVYAEVGQPVLVLFPDKISGGFKRKNSNLAIERNENFVVLFAQKTLAAEGEALLVRTEDLNFYSFKVKLADDEHKPDVQVTLSRPR